MKKIDDIPKNSEFFDLKWSLLGFYQNKSFKKNEKWQKYKVGKGNKRNVHMFECVLEQKKLQ